MSSINMSSPCILAPKLPKTLESTQLFDLDFYQSKTLVSCNVKAGSTTQVQLTLSNYLQSGCCCEVPNSRLMLVGGQTGFGRGTREVKSIDVSRGFAVTSEGDMSHCRTGHALVYFDGFVYALGGLHQFRSLNKCERYGLIGKSWENISSLPEACFLSSAAVKEDTECLYVLGGLHTLDYNEDFSLVTAIQELSFTSLTWRLLAVRLPSPDRVSCFTVHNEVYFIVNSELYKLQPQTDEIARLSAIEAKGSESYLYYEGKLFYCEEAELRCKDVQLEEQASLS
jgi:hypothetical protein